MKTLLVFALSAPLWAATCDSALSLRNGTITSAQTVGPGAFNPGGKNADQYKALPSFCRITASLRPAPDSEIKIEVWLPASGWNGDLQSVGNGAWAGSFSYPAMATALAAGYATASTDTGHTGNSADFITGHPEKVTDFLYRAVHEMTVAAKVIVAGYYGSPAKHSFWNGCSTGGRQAFVEVQRYPQDYDGVIAGAPANYITRLQGMQVWAAAEAHRDEAAYIPPQKYPLLHDLALETCDALDGVRDGVIENPGRCKVDPSPLLCRGADAPSCLTAPQLAFARKMYSGPQGMFPGVEPGSELGWGMLAGPKPSALAVEVYKFIVLEDPDWDYRTFDAQKDIARAQKLAARLDSTDPNLKPFFGRGGKLLIYHGWADPGVPPRNTVNYYESVVNAVGGASKTMDSMRLFMVPGMGHCRGGEGPDTFDAVTVLRDWVEQGKAPEQIVASRVRQGKVDRTRPLCPYPQEAVYKGSGSTDDAANFACRAR
jgi:feruloyl esterase